MNRNPLLPGFLAGLFALCGCVHLPSRCERTNVPPIPSALVERFASGDRKIVDVHETKNDVGRGYRLQSIELAISTELGSTNSQVHLDYYQPEKPPAGRKTSVILLLPTGGGDYTIEQIFARYFARRGFAVVIAQRRKISYEAKLESIAPWMEETVRDNRLALDWIETRPELDTNRIGLFGISTGGIRGVLLTAVEPRIRAATLGLAGGDLPYILTYSTEPGIVRRRTEYLRKNPVSSQELQRQLRENIQCDPNEMAAYIDCRKVFLVLAVCDSVVPFKKGWELRKNLGRPETLLVPAGHYTAALGIPGIERQSLRFFKKRLELNAGLCKTP